jgi:hypothetical protein
MIVPLQKTKIIWSNVLLVSSAEKEFLGVLQADSLHAKESKAPELRHKELKQNICGSKPDVHSFRKHSSKTKEVFQFKSVYSERISCDFVHFIGLRARLLHTSINLFLCISLHTKHINIFQTKARGLQVSLMRCTQYVVFCTISFR